ncbi:MAG: glutaredoxin 3 [Alphaproteobacteria bacterium]|nr:glutaredoxin 3 [Alphaproteobacteria bacterium]
MAKVEIYSTPVCPYCTRAKSLLKSKGQEYTEIDIAANPATRDEMMSKANGRRTVPQIFINNKHIGGFDDLHALDKKGELDALLAE